jgi:CRP-like cAMP-binding protein
MGIVLESKLVTYKSGDTIYEEGDKTKYIYFIINGEIELMKKVGRKSVILSSYGEF